MEGWVWIEARKGRFCDLASKGWANLFISAFPSKVKVSYWPDVTMELDYYNDWDP